MWIVFTFSFIKLLTNKVRQEILQHLIHGFRSLLYVQTQSMYGFHWTIGKYLSFIVITYTFSKVKCILTLSQTNKESIPDFLKALLLIIQNYIHLMSTHDNCFGAVITLQQSFKIASLAIRTPVGLFGIIRLHRILPFHLQGDHQVGAWIRIGLSSLSKFNVARHDELLNVNDSFSIQLKF